jgi:hypothetical protein
MEALQMLTSCLSDDAEAVRVHALAAFKDNLASPDMKEMLGTIMPEIFDWLVGMVESHGDGSDCATLLESLSACLYQFPQVMGLPPASDPRMEDEALCAQSVLSRHSQVLSLLVARFSGYLQQQEAMAARLSPQDLKLLEHRAVEYASAVHAVTSSCPKTSFGWIEQPALAPLLPFLQAVLAPSTLLMISRNSIEAEIADILTFVPRADAQIATVLAPLMLRALDGIPAMSDILVPQLCDIFEWSGSRLLVPSSQASPAAAMIATMVQRLLCNGLSSSEPSMVQCWMADLARCVLLMSSSDARKPSIVTYFTHRHRHLSVLLEA